MKKRGMSAVITTLLIILLTIVAVGILWVIVKNLVLEQADDVKLQSGFFEERLELSKIKLEPPVVKISLKKIGGETETETSNQTTQEETLNSDVFSVVDLSGSMRFCKNPSSGFCCTNTLHGSWSNPNCYGIDNGTQSSCISACSGTLYDRLTAAQNANKELISTIFETTGNRMGLIAYEDNVDDINCIDLIEDTNNLKNKIDSWEAGGSTCICCGINEAAERLQEQSSPDKLKTIIIMSDGEATVDTGCPQSGNPSEEAIEAACDAYDSVENLTIYAVGAGEDVNEDVLRDIAECGHGQYFSGTNIENLTEIYETIGEQINVQIESIHSFNNILFIFSNSTDSYQEHSSEIPQILGTKTYQINLSGKLEGELIKIEIYPLTISSSGKETIGPLYDSWEKN